MSIAPVLLNAQATPASQPGATTLSLDDAVRMAESQSEAVRIARAGVQRTEGQRIQARSQIFPQIYGSAGYTRTLKSQYSSLASSPDTTTSTSPAPPCDDYLASSDASVADGSQVLKPLRDVQRTQSIRSVLEPPFGQANQYQLGFSVSQSLFTGGRIAAQNEAAAAGRRSANIELTAQRAQNVLDVTQAYYDAALADAGRDQRSVVDADGERSAQVQLNKSVGNVSEFELLRAQVTRANQRPQVIQRRSDREVADLPLKQLLNIPLEQSLSSLLRSTLFQISGGNQARRTSGHIVRRT